MDVFMPEEMLYLEKLRQENKAFWANHELNEAEKIICKVCGKVATFIGNLDFSKTCADRYGEKVFQDTGCLVPYNKCPECGFIFTAYANNWNQNTIKTLIYNEEYHKADAPVEGFQAGVNDPRKTMSYLLGANMIDNFNINPEQAANPNNSNSPRLKILDFGSGGNPGPTGLCFEDRGFDIDSYEPYLGKTSLELKYEKYDFIYAIEVVEHVIDLHSLVEFMASHLSDTGLLHIRTVLHPSPEDNINSWYISPKNGHFSIFTLTSLFILFRYGGINIMQCPAGIIGFKNKPLFKNRMFV